MNLFLMKLKSIVSISLFILLVFLASAALAKNESSSCDEADFTKVIIPLTLNQGLPVVEVSIQGKLFHLVIDTGANATTIDLTPQVLNRITLKNHGVPIKSTDIRGKIYQSKSYTIDDFQIGNVHLSNLIAGEELRNIFPAEVDGIIGNQFLKSFFVLIDYQNATLILYPKTAYPDELNLNQWGKIDFEQQSTGIVLTAKIDTWQQDLKLCLDSGCVASDNKGRKYGVLISRKLPKTTLKPDQPLQCKHVLIDKIDLGPTGFWMVESDKAPVDGFLGENFFARFKVFIDFDNHTLFIKR